MPRSLSERVPYDAIIDRPPLTLPARCSLGGMAHRQHRKLGNQAPDAADCLAAPVGSAASARPPELGVARIWHESGILAIF